MAKFELTFPFAKRSTTEDAKRCIIHPTNHGKRYRDFFVHAPPAPQSAQFLPARACLLACCLLAVCCTEHVRDT